MMKQTWVTFIRILKSLFFTFMVTLKSLFVSSDPPSLPSLPMELMEEILCRLPVKLLIQLRCLSKSFNDLISDPKFARKHSMSTMHRHHLVVTYTDYDISLSPGGSRIISYPLHSIFYPRYSIFDSILEHTRLEYPFDKEYIINCGSCNGILCLALKQKRVAKVNNVLLWNPSIKKFKLLPSLKNTPVNNCRHDPVFGFGYDHVFDVYKVVVIFSKTQGMIHTLGTDTWRLINGDFPLPVYDLKFVSGALNWIPYLKNYIHSLASFDLVTESYKRLLQPNYGAEFVYNLNLDVSRDCLRIFASRQRFFDVWLMKEYGNEGSWTKLFHVPYLEEDPFISKYATYPLWLSEEDQVLMNHTFSLQSDSNYLSIYDLKNGTFKFPKIHNIKSFNGVTLEVCVQSLISPCF
ncbi:putative F-box domain-containing protein [Medicago truncatula]|uniref:F-box protein interaction domain protein n=2 Tax=Medicago truncatula TaxID=3880 RepID=A0A072U9A1_MEDTR|nr:F-box protein interaction domain protein [Medicago truncatula]RHN51452.1 putative F-box domain-containing protein [Medicago truncatula]